MAVSVIVEMPENREVVEKEPWTVQTQQAIRLEHHWGGGVFSWEHPPPPNSVTVATPEARRNWLISFQFKLIEFMV